MHKLTNSHPVLLGDLFEDVSRRIAKRSETPQLETQILLAHVLDKPRTWVLAHPNQTLTEEQLHRLEEAVSRFERGVPLPYILGHWEFYGLDLDLTPEVLIPRPETELMVERALSWLRSMPERRRIADVGTGSGCIAIALAMHVPNAHITATDLSEAALAVASRNALKFKVNQRINFVQCNLLPPRSKLPEAETKFDLICANLPYIPSETLRHLPVYGQEPTLALDGGPDGLDPLRSLLEISNEWLSPNGKLLLEIEASHGPAAAAIAYDAFNNAEIHLHRDLSGRDRLLEIQVLEE